MRCNHYIFTSSNAIYDLHKNIKEEEYSPTTNTIIYGNREYFSYRQGKQQAENTIFQVYKNINTTAVRFPVVLGVDDYTNRLYFYIEHIVKHIPMHITNLDAQISFINSKDAGHFLSYLATKNSCGAINACNNDTISIKEILQYIESKTNTKAILNKDGDNAPYNEFTTHSLDTSKAKKLGYTFTSVHDWIYTLLDFYIKQIESM